ncbi:MAG TPA: NAD(P)H-dependent oxidoreductase subunit E [Bacteroidales bacterium]|nr:NAD(P)H-dependent oxidoreductase subunit E [Bacteroidales bacterium]
MMKSEIDSIVQAKGTGKEAVIPILQAIQKQYNYLPEEALRMVCDQTEITAAEIVGVASFYSQFRFKPAGKHLVKVCVGTACHVKGSGQVYDALRRTLNLTDEQDTDAERLFTLQKVSCLGCCTLAPVVQIDDTTYGHIKPSMVSQILEDFKKLGKSSGAEKSLLLQKTPFLGEIRVGLGSCCVASGSDEVRQAVVETVRKSKLNIAVKQVGCVGMCHQVPLMEVVPLGKPSQLYAKVKPEDVHTILRKHFKSKGLLNLLKSGLVQFVEEFQQDSSTQEVERFTIDIREKHVHSFLGNQIPIATEHRGLISPLNLDEYLRHGGFEGLRKALAMNPQAVIDEVAASGIKGRGGAGFKTGVKWGIVASHNAQTKYIICNGDEGDPGAFMDRMLLESYPYRVLEGMIIAGWAVGATQGYLYIRAEYPLAVSRIKEALQHCREQGILGKDIYHSGYDLDIQVKEGAGAFVCGEETAMIASMEGKRGFPTLKPPYPAESGLWGFPTLINNTETLAQIPYILRNGYEKFSAVGTVNSKGTKVFALAGKINRGGLIEVPIGITIRQIIEEIGGGIPNGKKMKAVQIGGPSGGCVPESLADTPIDYETLTHLGAMMGSGGLVVLDETDCMVDIARYFLSFTQNESCGKCTFCRIGTKRMLDILERFCEGKAVEKDLVELENLANWTKKGSLCGLGKTAPNPVLSTLKYFREEYLAHLVGRCPSGKCKSLITYTVQDTCIGCTICAQECPSDAIPFTPHQVHTINNDLCIKCDICKQACPIDAIILT